MLKLDLKEAEAGAALVLAAVIAGQVAEDMGQRACIQGLADSLSVSLEDSTDRLREVYVAHLQRQLGQGFVVEAEEDGLVVVALDEAEEEPGEPEATVGQEGGEKPAEAPKKRRGRPPKARE